jgi:hypothetical protein
MVVIDVDGHATNVPWGDEFRSALAPGDHTVSAWYGLSSLRRGRASLAVQVADGETLSLQYRPARWYWSRGNLWEDHRYAT